MPRKPKRICSKPGCAELTSNKYCDKHLKEINRECEKQRESSYKRGYNNKWRRYRKMFLSRNPLCVHCFKEGRYISAKIVDHIIPHKGDMKLFWDSENHQPLCESCHNKKTAKEDGGFGNKH